MKKIISKKLPIFAILLSLTLILLITSTVISKNPTKDININEQITINNEIINSNQPNISDTVDPFEGLNLRNDNSGVPILCYHSIADDASTNGPITLSKDKFKEHLQLISDEGYTTLTISQLNNYILNNKAIPEKSVVITFDDGYMNNYTNAFPLLKEFNMNATMFVISGYSITNNAPHSGFMTAKEIKEMSDYGIDIQSHTVSHFELATLPYEQQLKELTDSKITIEKLTGKPVNSIAYPLGSYNEDSKKACLDAGYSMAFTIKRGYANRDDNQFELNRICIDYTYSPRHIRKVLTKLHK